MEKSTFDPNQPQGTMSLANLRNTLRALFQGDLMPLRPRASMYLDDFEYSTNANAQAQWSGTGCTVSATTTKHDGNNALQVAVDGTGNRKLYKTQSLILNLFSTITFWEQCTNALSQTVRLYLKDSLGNQIYWDCVTSGSSATWTQHTCTLASPTGGSAILSSIVEWGFSALPASKSFIFDTAVANCGKSITVDDALISSYFQQMYIGTTKLSTTRMASPAITAPSANPRIDLLTINSSGTLEWTTGTEASSPAEPVVPAGKIPIALVYQKTTMTKVVDYENKDANPNDGYIYKDIRPLIRLDSTSQVKTLLWYIKGTAETGTNVSARYDLDFAGTITKARMYSKTAPTGASLIADINKNGTSIWASTQANRVTVTAGNNTGSQTSFDTTAVAVNDYITIDLDQVGSTVAGEDITIELTIAVA